MTQIPGSVAPTIPEQVRERLARRMGTLQMLPAVAQEALETVNSPDCDLAKVASIIQRDLKLATFVLKLANSALFAPPKPIASLHHAVLFIGRRRARDFIITASLEGVASHVSKQLEARQAGLWVHGFFTAILSVKLNDLWGLKFQGEEFTAGLMHDFGRTLLLILDQVNTELIDPLDFLDSPGIEGREKQFLGASHSELGSWFAAHNELPAMLVAAIQFHHCAELAGEHKLLTALVAAADHAANQLQRAEGDHYDPQLNDAVMIVQKNGVPKASALFAEAIQGFLEEVPSIAHSMM